MTNILSLGIVYDNSFDKSEELQSIIQYFLNLKSDILGIKVSMDEDGENWLESERNEKNFILDYTLLTEKYFGEIQMQLNDFWSLNGLSLTLRIVKENEFFGYSLDFEMEQLLNRYSLDLINELIIDLVKDIYSVTKFIYAFCDHDSEIEYSPSQYKDLVEAYSILILPREKNGFDVIKNNWQIDGITSRNKI
ncbi:MULTISPECIES: Imm64 family immunity protein [Peribacillus]|uniref:Imm64 family immunity protein n=1 Tax=Peribacillus TaxID=2675229 RepID=UPI001F4E07CA|nr:MULTISPECIES: Imm64 family immunity protein [unclassified Peribacillus]MCK1985797.1 Imm64 family immunity protein [Peribacillus sp. Aquil_B1]MCK2010723.1 Imm64 family immunity protein [Peribacillus sp. Aquil_B8]